MPTRALRTTLPALALALLLPTTRAQSSAPAPPAEGFAAPASATTSAKGERRTDPQFDILEFRVEGNTVLTAREIERAVTPFLGEGRHFADVEAARKALEDRYQRLGYQTVFVDIPEQRIAGGVIVLKVMEARVGHVQVTGSRYFEAGEIRSTITELAPDHVPQFYEMQQQLSAVNRGGDRVVSPVLTPGRVPGTVDVNLSVKDSLPLHGDLEDDNYASPFTTADRLNASLHYDNLWQRHHSVALNYQVSPQKRSETNVLYATYLWKLRDSDDVLSFYGIRSNSNVAIVGSANILGNAKIAGVRWISPLGSVMSDTVSWFHSLTMGMDRKDFAQTNVSAQTANLTVLPPISYYPLSLAYSLTRAQDTSTRSLNLSLNTAPRGILGNSDEKFQSRRVLGNASYLAWKFDLSDEEGWGKRWGMFARLEGQWTADALISNEQFTTGGSGSVRGYRESELSGDRGLHATLEGRFFPWGRTMPTPGRSLYVAWFADAGEVRIVDPEGPQIPLLRIASTGLGVHGQGWRGAHFALDVARALEDGGRGPAGPITAKGNWRAEASLGWGF